MLPDRLLLLLIGQYLVMAGVFAWCGDRWRALYFLSAAGISWAVRGMH